MHRTLPVALTAGSVAWVAVLLLAPVTPAAAFASDIAAGVCHQRPERSFHLSGVPLPVCARCFGLYLSGAMGAVVASIFPRRRHWSADARTARRIFAIAALPTFITVALEWSGMADPSNLARAVAALPLGAAAGWIFVRMLLAEAP